MKREENETKQTLKSNNLDEVDKVVDVNEEILLEQFNPDDYSLSYTFFLIPENPLHHLTGRLANCLSENLTNVCELNGWKLDFLAINQDYIHLILLVRPVVTTMQIVQQVRAQTNEQIVGEFKEDINLGGQEDFWAPGYLLLHGKHPTEDKVIGQYIRLIRDNQKRQKFQDLDTHT